MNEEAKHPGIIGGLLILVTAAALLLGAAVGAALAPVFRGVIGGSPGTLSGGNAVTPDGSAVNVGSPEGASSPSASRAGTIAPVASGIDKVMPSVVAIGQEGKTGQPTPPFFSAMAGKGGRIGAGVFFRSDGYVITNQHVVGKEKRVIVGLPTGTYVKGDVVGYDLPSDIAVVKVPVSASHRGRKGFPVPSFESEAPLRVGETLVALGSPGGLQHRVTFGTVSALSRSAWVSADPGRFFTDLIEIDGAISEGSSGGPVVNSRGDVVGIGTLVITGDSAASDIGFAIPTDSALEIAKAIIAGKKRSQPFVGIIGQSLSPGVAAGYGIKVDGGAIVTAVIPGSPAHRAGVRNGDVVVAVDGRPIYEMFNLVAAIDSHKIGDRIRIQIYRDGELTVFPLEVKERPASF